jgi:hypothetical protein
MKAKLTLSIDRSVIDRSKKHAARNGTSLSQLVQDLLEKKLAEGEEDFVDKWRGKLVWREERAGDPRYEYLKRKYS